MTTLARLRWFIVKPSTGYRGLEEIVNSACGPALDELRAKKLVDAVYVSKHATEVWLTLFSDLSQDVKAVATVEPHLHPYLFRSDHTSDPAAEELLQSRCDDFRACLDLMTRIALDVHRAGDLEKRQKELIAIGRAGRTSRDRLSPYLERYSSTFRAIADRDEFWAGVGCNCLRDPTDCLHWLYNLVLGFDWEWSRSEADIARQLGLSWP